MYSDSGQFCLGREFGGEVGLGGLECLGGLCCYWVFTRGAISHGDRV